MSYYLVYWSATGRAYSYGSVLADPMPDGFTVRPMTVAERDGVVEGRLMWDADSLAFVDNPNWPPEPPPSPEP